MTTTWILVAHRGGGRLFENSGPGTGLRLIQTIDHPQGRLKSGEINSDKPGRAFDSFGGVPKRVVPDNLKAAVLKALVHDPVLGEAYRRLALHYGFLISPTVLNTPRHKGKVESGVHYVKRNFLAGQEFVDIKVGNERLWRWIREVAGTRIHGTTRQAPDRKSVV